MQIKTNDLPAVVGFTHRGLLRHWDMSTPEHPLGATMVSAEGACAAYYAYGRHLEKTEAAVVAP